MFKRTVDCGFIYNRYLMNKRLNQKIECIYEKSARTGDITMLSWLVKSNNNKQVKDKVIYLAAGNGHLDIVKMLYTSDKHSIVREWAKWNGRRNVIDWLKRG